MILTVTLNPAVDHTIQVESLPAPDTVARTDTAQFDAGGKGINVSQNLSALGAETLATGLVGDFLGDYITRALRAEGLDFEFVDIDGQTRLNTTILDSENEVEYKINHTGPTVDAGAIAAVIEILIEHDPSMVLVAGSLPPGLDSHAIDRIAEAGPWETVADVGGERLAQLDADYALCKPNRPELEAATGQSIDSLDDCIAAAHQLRSTGFDRVVTSLGSEGALLVGADETLHAEALAVDVVDTVGAGDAMVSGVLLELARGNDARRALQRGVAVASRMVTVPGTKLPAVDDLDDLTAQVEITTYEQ
ncbi:fructose-1-phosphate kinase [Halohasta litchfieldiae]|jgi:1-phosphofructokinase|uniref:Fructose-1-phosphate kinase n=1 Tax=Halohasta litchfieldiae TaxID=1073996 RepID=A0A1H6WDM5_9EURY|nr:1-phosphofructokinase [Halohasta litchfieldiae]ATW87800.1 fructose-1-phosphate kinase [Halohasta litchfieldiae]SEJ15121.1 fructose-1-phosphate kinase [Halohasta litchfieldiae]